MKIYIKTTESCNLACKHCYIGEHRQKTAFFDEVKTVEWLKKYIKDNNIQEEDLLISFHGGEPFLAPLDKLEYVAKHFSDAEFDATTNLTYPLTDEWINFVKTYFVRKSTGKPFIKTSWDYDIRFNSSEQMKLWESNVKTLRTSDFEVKVITCLTTKLLQNVAPSDYAAYMKSLDVSYIDFERLTDNTTEDKTLIPTYSENDKWLLSLYNTSNDLNIDKFNEMRYAINKTHIGCRKRECMRSTLTINADGSIGGCPNTSLQNPFYSVDGYKNEEKRNKLINNEFIRNPICYSCDLYEYCNGSCHQLSWKNGECPEPKQLWRQMIHDMERA